MASGDSIINQFLKRVAGSGAQQPVSGYANERGEQLVSYGLPPYTQLTLENKGWQVMNTSALAALVVRPSTTANFSIYNNNSVASNICLVIDRIFAFNLVSTAAQARSGMWACVHPTGTTAMTADITAIKSTSGLQTAYAGGVIADTAATVTDNGWFPIGNWSDVEPTGVLPGGIMEFKAEGRFVIPPTAAISGQVVSSVVGNTFTMGFSWYELALTVGTPG